MKIDKDIPIPTKHSRSRYAATVLAWEVGDSILMDSEADVSTVRCCSQRHGQTVSVRKMEGGWRVWRTK